MKKGISASKGYAIGNVVIKDSEEITFVEKASINIEEENNRLDIAIENSRHQLTLIRDKTNDEMGADKAAVFDSHLMLLDDPEFTGTAKLNIESNNSCAEVALKQVLDMYLEIFENMEDEYMRERAADLKDVGERIIRNLTGKLSSCLTDISENTVVVANDLTPSDTAQLDKSKVIAFLTNVGGRTSHSAIMARTLEIPAIVGLENITTSVKDGDTVIVDGVEGVVIINPDENTLSIYKDKKISF